jgi:hypothetical protein
MYGIAQLGNRVCGYLLETLGGDAPISTLMNGLMSYWRLDETSGTRVDAIGDNDLTDNNTVGSEVRAPMGQVALFNSANVEFLSSASTALSLGNSPYTFSIWSYVTDAINNAPLLIKGKDNLNEYFLAVDDGGSGNGHYRYMWKTRGQSEAVYSHGSYALIENTGWHHLIVRRDPSNSQIGMIFDGGTPVTTATAGTITSTANIFSMGSFANLFNYSGDLVHCALWPTRVLSAPERAELWNGGVGKFLNATATNFE